ncbi:hypothetical protein [Neorhizobium alkalisoli]|uniref:CYTH domain-containing protein n=1 Tax=Neorhizobium alkalisoli TaxID=528178 RepID=A0A561R219_9HYPH|nr:hypothetical protein [Neorhizobium alkalisoli]TWF56667.1 hypothetical protein FHW37_102305 [Neorhizobium alkalisoli]
MDQAELSSRECKLTLRAERFSGNQQACRSQVAQFWEDAGRRLKPFGIATKGRLVADNADKQREIIFLDTEANTLYRRSDLVFRLRRKLGSNGDWEATLKFRHGDRLLAASQNFAARKRDEKDDAQEKFEEDVKLMPPADTPRFWALFSRSAKAEFDPGSLPRTVGDCLAPYDNVPQRDLPPKDTAVCTVRGLNITEHVFEDGKLDFGDFSAKCALILWWKKPDTLSPVAAEFSFRFDLDEVDEAVVRNAWTALSVLYGLPWIDLKGVTKTGLVYGSAEV